MTRFQLSTLDLPQLQRHAIGFDRLFDELTRTFANSKQDNYPPHNVIRTGENTFTLEVAVAGFSEEDLDVEIKENVLTIRGERKSEDAENGIEYLHRGIGGRDFERTFTLAEHVEVKNASVVNGILSVALERIVPEENKPRKIAITFSK